MFFPEYHENDGVYLLCENGNVKLNHRKVFFKSNATKKCYNVWWIFKIISLEVSLFQKQRTKSCKNL